MSITERSSIGTDAKAAQSVYSSLRRDHYTLSFLQICHIEYVTLGSFIEIGRTLC